VFGRLNAFTDKKKKNKKVMNIEAKRKTGKSSYLYGWKQKKKKR
jgi:hypothetical protein